jgi:tetratricopeptide (TPR) repeat protein
VWVILLGSQSYANFDGFGAHAIAQYQRSFLAHYSLHQGDHQKAQHYYDTLLSYSVPVTAYRGYVEYLLDTHQYPEIVKLAEEKPFLFKSDQPGEHDIFRRHKMAFMLAQALEGVGKTEQAAERLLELAQLMPSNQEVIYYTVKALMRAERVEIALTLLDKLLKENTEAHNNFIFHFLRYGILCDLHEFKEARKSLQKALELHPQFEQGWLFLGILNEQFGHLDQAIEGYQRFIDLVGRDQLIEQRLMQLKLAHERSHCTLFSKAQDAYRVKDYNQAYELTQKCLNQGYTSNDVHLLKLDSLTSLGRWPEAFKLLESKFSHQHDDSFWLKIAHTLYLAHPEQAKDLELFILNLHKKHPGSLRLTLYAIDIALRMSDFKKVIELCTQALPLIKDPLVEAKVLFQMCSIYYITGDHKPIYELLQKPVLTNTSYIPLLNFAAYYHATKGRNTEKAQRYIQRVLEKEKSNPHYQDTHAVILYKQKKYKPAHAILKRLIQQVPDDMIILKHYAKVCSAIGHYQAAYSALVKVRAQEKRPAKKKRLDTRISQIEKLQKNGS